MSIIQAAGSGEVSTGFYKHLLDQSLKVNEADSSYLTRTITSAGDRKKSTFSCWFKLSGLSGSNDWSQTFYNQGANNGSYHYVIGIYNNAIYINDYDYGSSGSPGSDIILQTNRLFRDTSAWYHLVVRVDTTQSTAADRVRVYINGTQETSFSTATYPSQNADLYIMNHTQSANGSTSLTSVFIGRYINGYNDGYMAEVNYCDGQTLGPDSFGETKDGIWIPKDTSGLTFGTNGFHLTFKDDVVSEGFNTALYNATESNQSISGIGFQPDLVFAKNRDSSSNGRWGVIDSVRGVNKTLATNMTAAEVTSRSDLLTSFDADGFTLGADADAYGWNNQTYTAGDRQVAFCWEAGGAPTADNSAGAGATPTSNSVKIDGSNLGSALAGSIAATRLSANTSQGFSIGTFTKGSGTETVAHGLGAAPDWLIVKRTNGTGSWAVYHSGNTANPETDYLRLNSNGATADDATFWGDTAPTSTVFSIGSAFNSGEELVFYAWTDITGYSKFGSYTGNGSATGPSVTLGFTPAWIMLKRTDGGSEDWNIHDNTRSPANPITDRLFADLTTAETTSSGYAIDFNSNGFQLKGTDGGSNASGATYIYMAFADTREAAFFKDVSSNGNNFTPVNLDYRDSVPDVPTNNFATFNPLDAYAGATTFSEGNLKGVTTSGGTGRQMSTIRPVSGKWYAEFYVADSTRFAVGIENGQRTNSAQGGNDANSIIASYNGQYYYNGGGGSYMSSLSNGNIVQVAMDVDNKLVFIGINNTWQNSATASEIVAATATNSLGAKASATAATLFQGDMGIFTEDNSGSGAMASIANFGQDSSFDGNHATANSNADGNGHGSFAYAPPSGFLALCSQNLPDVAIIDGSDNFNTVLYTGTGSSNAITGVGFSPDFTWIKKRNGTTDHQLVNSVVGYPNGTLLSNQTDAEYTAAARVDSADADGFTVSSPGQVNASSDTYVAWNWLAGTAFSNDASATSVGTIDSEGQVNTTAGFSIIKYTGTGSNGTVAHGLSSAPELVIVKERSGTGQWSVQSTALSAANKVVHLQSTAAEATKADHFNSTLPTSTVFSVGTSGNTNGNTNTFIAFCFHSVEGYSKVGSYTGNGNANGTFVYTGFRPAWIIIKASDSTQTWWMHDNKRDVDNVVEHNLGANLSSVEDDDYPVIDFLSNGFKCRSTDTSHNGNGNVIIYLAFADQPFKFSNAR